MCQRMGLGRRRRRVRPETDDHQKVTGPIGTGRYRANGTARYPQRGMSGLRIFLVVLVATFVVAHHALPMSGHEMSGASDMTLTGLIIGGCLAVMARRLRSRAASLLARLFGEIPVRAELPRANAIPVSHHSVYWPRGPSSSRLCVLLR